MFEFVNIIAVIGTTFFMMAVATLWYSEYLFQKSWLKATNLTEVDMENAAPNMKRSMVLTFLSYGVTVFCISVAIGYSQVFGVSVQKISLLLVVGFSAFLGAFTVWEQRPLTYYLITTGFVAIFILGSTFFLYHWPW